MSKTSQSSERFSETEFPTMFTTNDGYTYRQALPCLKKNKEELLEALRSAVKDGFNIEIANQKTTDK